MMLLAIVVILFSGRPLLSLHITITVTWMEYDMDVELHVRIIWFARSLRHNEEVGDGKARGVCSTH
jgi:hypothetical protein